MFLVNLYLIKNLAKNCLNFFAYQHYSSVTSVAYISKRNSVRHSFLAQGKTVWQSCEFCLQMLTKQM